MLKLEKNIKIIISNIMQAAIDISCTTDTDVFMSYSPHIQSISIWIYPIGWKADDKYYNKYDVDLTSTTKDVLHELIKVYRAVIKYRKKQVDAHE